MFFVQKRVGLVLPVLSLLSAEHVIRMPVAGIVIREMARKLARQMSGKLQALRVALEHVSGFRVTGQHSTFPTRTRHVMWRCFPDYSARTMQKTPEGLYGIQLREHPNAETLSEP